MSDTPRTDEAERHYRCMEDADAPLYFVPADFARGLERELRKELTAPVLLAALTDFCNAFTNRGETTSLHEWNNRMKAAYAAAVEALKNAAPQGSEHVRQSGDTLTPAQSRASDAPPPPAVAAPACCGETPCQWGDHPCERKKPYPLADAGSTTTVDSLVAEFRGKSVMGLSIALADHGRFLEAHVGHWKRLYECAQNANAYRQTALTVLDVGEPCAGKWSGRWGEGSWECPCGAKRPHDCRTETAKP